MPMWGKPGDTGRGWQALAVGWALWAAAAPAVAVDVNALWDYGQPAVSEQRFTAAMQGASADDRLILLTQIARTHGLRGDFAEARRVLSAVAPALGTASAEVQVRYHLELGRTHASTAHPEDALTPDHLDLARRHFQQAFDLARGARLDVLAIDALHMMPVIDAAPDQQIAWDRKALAYMAQSDQADAQGWEGALRNNLGYALRLKGDYEAALAQFRLSRDAYERRGRVHHVRYADWMIARTYRAQGRLREAVDLQTALERAWDAEGSSDPEVYEELEILHRALGDDALARHYADKLKRATR